jgi:hypothetical protein
MNKFFFVFFLLQLGFQNISVAQLINNLDGLSKAGTNLIIRENFDVSGSEFAFDKWESGAVVNLDDSVHQCESVNYHTIEEVFYVKMDDDRYMKLNKLNFKKVQLERDDKLLEFKNIVYNDIIFSSEVLYEGDNISLYKRYVGTKTLNDKSSSYSEATTRYSIKKAKEYYIRVGDEIQKLPKKGKKIIEALNKPSLKSYSKSEKLNLKKDKDLIQLVGQYDKL